MELKMATELSNIRDTLNSAFKTKKTFDYEYRVNQLKSLQKFLELEEDQIAEALQKDLSKPYVDAHSEVLSASAEIDYVLSHLKAWIKPTETDLPMFLAPGKSEIHYEPLGVVLIIGPFNFPVILTVCFNGF
jgi:aldehyde dehydrogenase (NAD+)